MTQAMDRVAFTNSRDAEVIGGSGAPWAAHLLIDASQTGGALSTVEVRLTDGADGAGPHYHTRSHELFYVTEGELQVLTDEEIRTVGAGSALVVPKHTVHAFGAVPGSAVRFLITLTPGVERFDYFRLLGRIERGEATRQEIIDTQDVHDNYFVDSPTWRAARR
ncbi:cupin domain-containing protein [Nocardia sp. NPDC020380]|uniref:cupin domain-containing protein n=1 Tax=Nocardia sp. NPDC020380 TaxID=3364309 RepID=UPI0037A8DE86